MKISRKVIVIFAIILLLVFFALFITWENPQEENHIQFEEKIITAEKDDLISTISVTGIIQPKTKVEIIAPKRGRIDTVLAEEGAKIRKNQVLALISSEERVGLLDTAYVNLEEAKKSKNRRRIREARKELNLAKTTYKQIPIVAPIDGTLIYSDVKPGQNVSLDKILFILADVLVVVAQVDEVDIGKVKIDQPVKVTTDAFPDKVFEGKVTKIAFESKVIDNVTYYDITTDLSFTDGILKSGMTANVEITIFRKKDVLLVPKQVIIKKKEGEFVMLRKADGTYEERPVKTGLGDRNRIEILNGLNVGDKIVVKSEGSGEESEGKGRKFKIDLLKFFRK